MLEAILGRLLVLGPLLLNPEGADVPCRCRGLDHQTTNVTCAGMEPMKRIVTAWTLLDCGKGWMPQLLEHVP